MSFTIAALRAAFFASRGVGCFSEVESIGIQVQSKTLNYSVTAESPNMEAPGIGHVYNRRSFKRKYESNSEAGCDVVMADFLVDRRIRISKRNK
jgi:hypothetical protein